MHVLDLLMVCHLFVVAMVLKNLIPSKIQKGIIMRYKKCKRCRLTWNISVGQYIPETGYVCPNCSDSVKEREEARNVKSEFNEKANYKITNGLINNNRAGAS